MEKISTDLRDFDDDEIYNLYRILIVSKSYFKQVNVDETNPPLYLFLTDLIETVRKIRIERKWINGNTTTDK